MRSDRDVVLAYVDAFNRADLDGVCKTFAADALISGVLGWGTPEQARLIWNDLMECLEVQLQVDGLIENSGEVAVRYTERGRSAKPFRGFEPTGRTYEIPAMEWFEVKGGLIRRRWGARDSASQMRQLGFTK